MARRYIGDAVVEIEYVGGPRDEYRGRVTAGRARWDFAGLYAPPAGVGGAYDGPEAYDRMAASAVSFGAYYTSHNRGHDTPDWAPSPSVADAIDEATSWVMDERGEYDVRRRR